MLVQCERCGCNGSGRVNARERLIAVNVAAMVTRGRWVHKNCDGLLVAYDIDVSDG